MIDRYLREQGLDRGPQAAAILALFREALRTLSRMDPQYVLAVAVGIDALDRNSTPLASSLAEAIQLLEYGSLRIAALNASDGLRDRILAIQAMSAIQQASRVAQEPSHPMQYVFCPCCGVGMFIGATAEHLTRCAQPIIDRYRDEIEGNLPMEQMPCGCKYKMFNNNPLALSVKPCLVASEILSSEAMARHLGLIETPGPELVPGQVPSQRRTRSWRPR